MAQASRSLTLQNFGRTMRLFAPLYLSNECINNCRYCGFSRDNPILRVTLDVDEVIAEARHLARLDFGSSFSSLASIPKFVSRDYLTECVRCSRPGFFVDLDRGRPMESGRLCAGCRSWRGGPCRLSGTYNRGVYARNATAGPKRDFNFRLDCVERGYAAGFRRLGIGALIGLSRWQDEAIALAAHLNIYINIAGRRRSAVSLPRCVPRPADFVRSSR
jgi:2-iminoacetate synthase